MTEDEFLPYCQASAAEYAQEKVDAGNWPPEGALQRAEQEFRKLLPDGPRSENNYLYTLSDEGSAQKIGMIWFFLDPSQPQRVAFIYDFVIYETFRRQGYGLKALQAAEQQARQLGAQKMELHVFGHNLAARALYEKAGYQVTNLYMRKLLEG